MAHRSRRAWPGGFSAGRPTWINRSVFVTLPHFGEGRAGSTTSARIAVSVAKMSCTTRCSSFASAARAWSRSGRSWPGSRPDEHAGDAPGRGLLDDLHHGQAGLAAERRPTWPRTAHARPRGRRAGSSDTSSGSGRRRSHPARCSGRAAGAGSGAGPADLAGQQRQRDQAARVVGAVHVLAHAHAPRDDRALSWRRHAHSRGGFRPGTPQISAMRSGVASAPRP